jgi:hypothetical protein
LVAANSCLDWYPGGTDREYKLAEYNAVFVEMLLWNSYSESVRRVGRSKYGAVLRYMEWLAEVYYAPFPMSAQEAKRALMAGIDPQRMANLSPYFYDMYKADMPRKVGEFRLDFEVDDVPCGSDEFGGLVLKSFSGMRV